MASIFAGTEPPEWLREIAHPIDAAGTGQFFGTLLAGITDAYSATKEKNKTLPPDKQTSFWEQLPQSFHDDAMRLRDPFYDIHMKEAQLNLGQQALQMQATQQNMNYKGKQMALQAQDQQTLAEWNQKYDTLEKRKDAPVPDLRSDSGIKAYEGIRRADNQQENQRTVDRYRQQFNAAYSKADNKTKATIDRKMAASNGQITPDMWDDLGAGAEKTPPPMTSAEGKRAQDRQKLVEFYGEDHPAVKSFDEGIAASNKSPTPETYTDKETGERFLRYGKIIRKLSDFTLDQQEALRTAREKMRKAISDGNKADIKSAQAELDTILAQAKPATAISGGTLAPSGNRYIIK